MGGDCYQGEGGVSLNIIIIIINFCLMRGGYDLVLGHTSPISQPPPLQVIIEQSLISNLAGVTA